MREVFALIDWMMHLRPDLDVRFGVELSKLEEELHMPYVTSIERLAEARGEARVVVRLLTKVCGNVPKETQEQVRRLPSDQLAQLADDLLQFQSLADLQNWLDQHAKPDAD